MNAYTVVGPTKLQPRRLRSLDNATDAGDVATSSLGAGPNSAWGHM